MEGVERVDELPSAALFSFGSGYDEGLAMLCGLCLSGIMPAV